MKARLERTDEPLWLITSGKTEAEVSERLKRIGTDLEAAKERGDTQIVLHAQCSAEGFYLKNGFVARGDVFEEAGIRHIDMVRVLKTE